MKWWLDINGILAWGGGHKGTVRGLLRWLVSYPWEVFPPFIWEWSPVGGLHFTKVVLGHIGGTIWPPWVPWLGLGLFFCIFAISSRIYESFFEALTWRYLWTTISESMWMYHVRNCVCYPTVLCSMMSWASLGLSISCVGMDRLSEVLGGISQGEDTMES